MLKSFLFLGSNHHYCFAYAHSYAFRERERDSNCILIQGRIKVAKISECSRRKGTFSEKKKKEKKEAKNIMGNDKRGESIEEPKRYLTKINYLLCERGGKSARRN